MKKSFSLLTILLLICIIFSTVACDTTSNNGPTSNNSSSVVVDSSIVDSSIVDSSVNSTDSSVNGGEIETPDEVDYAGSVKLVTDGSNTSVYKKVNSVKSYIDGDTTHFYVDGITDNGVLKARYLAVNTPESTGKIEEWGKAASNFTKSKLLGASEIIIESDTATWDVDSTGDRHLVWVWYKTEGATSYRNLNIELLQNGYAIASNSANNKYGEICMNAIAQAKSLKYHVYSKEKDPDFPYGAATELTLKELRLNVADYDNCNVAFEGVVTHNYSNTIYVEDYDAESDMYYGMQVYIGFNPSYGLPQIISIGNKVRIVGTVTYYETGGTYQVSGLTYNAFKPDDPSNTTLIEKGHSASFRLTDANTFANGKVTIYGEESATTHKYAALAIYSSIEMHDLYVKSVYTTNNGGDSDGAMTLTCESNGVTISVRTSVLRNENNELVTANDFKGKTIDVKGIVNVFDGTYQINIFTMNDVVFH